MLSLERRATISHRALALAPLAAIGFTLVISTLLLALAGAPVGRAFALLIEGAFGSHFALAETLTRATPLMLTGLACAIAFRARFYNIGAEGQLYLGALAAVAVSGFALPAPLLFVLMLLAAALAAGLWLLLSALLKSRLGVDEVVTTLLGNFIVLLFVSMMLDGPMKDPLAMGWPQSVALPPELEFSRLMERTRAHSGLLLALGLAVLLWLMQRYSKLGLSIRAVGASPPAARFLGLPSTKTLLITALLSGALAGLAGAVEVAGRTGYVTLEMSTGYGYTGVVVAMLAALHPLRVILASVFIAAILVGADSMSRSLAVPNYLADVIVATALLSMLVASLFGQYRLRFRT